MTDKTNALWMVGPFDFNHKNKYYDYPEQSLNSDLVNWFVYTLHKFVEFPPLSDIELCVTMKTAAR